MRFNYDSLFQKGPSEKSVLDSATKRQEARDRAAIDSGVPSEFIDVHKKLCEAVSDDISQFIIDATEKVIATARSRYPGSPYCESRLAAMLAANMFTQLATSMTAVAAGVSPTLLLPSLEEFLASVADVCKHNRNAGGAQQ